MTRDHVGFDHEALIERIFKCCVEEHGSELPAHDEQTVERALAAHVHAHSAPAVCEIEGIVQVCQRCSAWPCRLCGLAYARFELYWYFQNIAQADRAEVRLVAAQWLPPTDPVRRRLERGADKLIAGLFSRPLLLANARGRPSLGLAHAVAQHLRSGGFPHPAIAKLMGITTAAAAMRSWGAEMRSVVPYQEALGPLAN